MPDFAIGAEFPFEHELSLDVEPLPGSRRVPSLEVEKNGRAELDLWCARVQLQVTVAEETITIASGPTRAQPCSSADLARGDEELLAALVQMTSWRLEDDVLVLIGPQTLRFRLSTH